MTLAELIALGTSLAANASSIVQGCLAILGGAAILSKLTPTEADDKLVQKGIDLIHLLALNLKVSTDKKAE